MSLSPNSTSVCHRQISRISLSITENISALEYKSGDDLKKGVS